MIEDRLAPPASYDELYLEGHHDRVSGNGHHPEEERPVSSLSSLSSPPPIDAALHGPLGYYVHEVAETTEADPAGILAVSLAGIGTMLGRQVKVVSGEDHYANLFVAPIGRTARARKGTAVGVALRLLGQVASDFDDTDPQSRIRSSFGSGEAMVRAVCDKPDGTPVDRRLLVVEYELARVLKVVNRRGSTLSENIRDAFDGRTLRRGVVATGESLVAPGAHIGIVGCITREELTALASEVDVTNGLLNRILWVEVRSQGAKPRVQPLAADAVKRTADVIRRAVVHARKSNRTLGFTNEGGKAYDAAYERLVADDPPGALGSVVARAEEHMTRLALIYAVLDRADAIDAEHVDAAMGLWEYARASAARVWSATGNRLADRIHQAAVKAGDSGISRTFIREEVVGSNSVRAKVIDQAVATLVSLGLVTEDKVETDGRPSTIIRATGGREYWEQRE